MSATIIKQAIERACEDLAWISAGLAKIGSSGTLSPESNLFFQAAPNLATQLEHTKELLIIRDAAFEALRTFPLQISTTSPGMFRYNNLDVSFRNGRYLLLQNYCVSTWAVYDTLAKVAGFLCCSDEFSKNPQKPVKLYEDFLQGKNCVGARVRDHLRGAYGWPISLSYKIRNWLAHDGHSHEGVELFKYNSLAPSGEFEVLESAWDIIVASCKAEQTQTRLRPFPDVRLNLLQGLSDCHDEADEAIAFLVLWSTGVARLQAQILFPRDVSPVAPTAVVTSVPTAIP